MDADELCSKMIQVDICDGREGLRDSLAKYA